MVRCRRFPSPEQCAAAQKLDAIAYQGAPPPSVKGLPTSHEPLDLEAIRYQ
jgi:hypothetical protein